MSLPKFSRWWGKRAKRRARTARPYRHEQYHVVDFAQNWAVVEATRPFVHLEIHEDRAMLERICEHMNAAYDCGWDAGWDEALKS